jgi:hypothetical protein
MEDLADCRRRPIAWTFVSSRWLQWVFIFCSLCQTGRPSSYAVVKFLLPMIDIKGELCLKDFGTMKKCNTWLGGGGIGRGMTWDKHMNAAVAERRLWLGPCKFSLGGIISSYRCRFWRPPWSLRIFFLAGEKKHTGANVGINCSDF